VWRDVLALIRRTALVDAPHELLRSRSLALDRETLLFPGGLRAGGTDGPALNRLEGAEELTWIDGEGDDAHRLTITTAPLAGGSTWVTWVLETPEMAGSASSADVSALTSWLGELLAAFRASVEQEYQAQLPKSAP
jgi:hypothetical protein